MASDDEYINEDEVQLGIVGDDTELDARTLATSDRWTIGAIAVLALILLVLCAWPRS